MKKKVILFYVVLAILASVCIALGFTYERKNKPTTAFAEVVEEEIEQDELGEIEGILDGIIPETEASKWFSDTIKPTLLPFASALFGVVVGGLIIFGKIRKIKDALTEAKKTLTESTDKTKNTESAIKKQQDKFEKEVNKRLDSVESMIKDTNAVAHKLLKVEELAYIGNTALVGNGTAKKIAEVVQNEIKN